jgi:hypothetical protein
LGVDQLRGMGDEAVALEREREPLADGASLRAKTGSIDRIALL